MAMKKKLKCDCHLHERQVCDICQGVTGKERDKDADKSGRFGYHTKKITRGELGELSKIQEEMDELKDAEDQGVKILIHCELADLYGALRKYARKYNLSMSDLEQMATLTEIAFRDGYR